MNGAELDVAIEQANRIFSRRHQCSDGAQGNAETPTSEPKRTDWPWESLDGAHRFGQPHAKLFPFIGRKVRTPAGPGTLIQVFAGRVTIVLDSDIEKCSFFKPAEIEPISWEL
jgi:hypothetical protein